MTPEALIYKCSPFHFNLKGNAGRLPIYIQEGLRQEETSFLCDHTFTVTFPLLMMISFISL